MTDNNIKNDRSNNKSSDTTTGWSASMAVFIPSDEEPRPNWPASTSPNTRSSSMTHSQGSSSLGSGTAIVTYTGR